MPQMLSPGLFVEELPASAPVVGPVSTSTCGAVGWTPSGPAQVATLVGSFAEFVSTFGTFDSRSFMAYNIAGFFANGGTRLYVVRVPPSDALAAKGYVRSVQTDQLLATGDGATTTFSATSSTTTLRVNNGASPIVTSTVSIRFRAKGSTTLQQAKERDGSTSLAAVSGTLNYEGRIATASLPTYDPHLLAVVPIATGDSNPTKIEWTSSSVTKSITIAPPVSGTVSTATNGAGSAVIFDFATGFFSLSINSAETPDNATAIQAQFYPATATLTVIDDGAGNLTGSALSASGSIGYTTGAYAFTTTGPDTPHTGAPILITYTIDAWALSAISAGVWGNTTRLLLSGSANYFTSSTATYSRFDAFVQQQDPVSLNWVTKETYTDLDWATPTSAYFAPDIINAFSALISITEPGADQPPKQLSGISYTEVVAGGDTSTAGRLINTTLGGTAGTPIQPFTVVITYTTVDGAAHKITDDGNGNLIGDVDVTYVPGNTINYTTGAVNFKTLSVSSAGIQKETLVTVSWYTAPVETQHIEQLGDSTKSYTAGTDGTFDSTHYSETQLTSVALSASGDGLYALDKVDELMQVIVPDMAGLTTPTQDLLTYANNRATQSSGGDRFVVAVVPQGSTATGAVNWFRNTLAQFSNYSALYWPWIKVADPLKNGRNLTIPPLGHLAGIYARTDNSRGVAKAPAGTIDGALQFITDLEVTPTQTDRDTVYPNKINPLIKSPQTGMAVWGAQTISNDPQWQYINVRRLFMFLEKSIYNSTFWVVFENNGPALWARISAQLNSFMLNQFNAGQLAGTTPSQAFFVICDNTNNTAASIATGQVVVDIGAAAQIPAVFTLFRFQQITNTG